MIIPLFLFTKNYVIVFFFLQGRFFKVFQQNDFQISLLHVTGSGLNELLQAYNLSWSVWFNVWFIVAQAINLYWFDTSFLLVITQLINFNSILFVGFIVGNTISNSDMITVKSGILRMLGSSFIFGITISLSYAIFQGLTMLNSPLIIFCCLLLGVIISWYYHIKQQKKINYIPYYL